MRYRAHLLSLLAIGCSDNQTHPSEHADYQAGAQPALSCVPDLDGKIEASEMRAMISVPVKYTVSPAGKTRAIDVAGAADSSGHLVWDWGTDYADDQIASLAALTLADKWYAASFPGGQFVTPFDAGDAVEAVYAQDDVALWLLGLASAQENPPEGKTLLVYAPPVKLYALPLEVGASWSTTGSIKNGTLRGLPYAGQDTYEGTDDATGQLVLPDFTFTQAHRVRLEVTVAPTAGQNVVTRQASLLFECFGEVARATSQPGESNQDFTTAAEVRRLGY